MRTNGRGIRVAAQPPCGDGAGGNGARIPVRPVRRGGRATGRSNDLGVFTGEPTHAFIHQRPGIEDLDRGRGQELSPRRQAFADAAGKQSKALDAYDKSVKAFGKAGRLLRQGARASSRNSSPACSTSSNACSRPSGPGQSRRCRRAPRAARRPASCSTSGARRCSRRICKQRISPATRRASRRWMGNWGS